MPGKLLPCRLRPWPGREGLGVGLSKGSRPESGPRSPWFRFSSRATRFIPPPEPRNKTKRGDRPPPQMPQKKQPSPRIRKKIKKKLTKHRGASIPRNTVARVNHSLLELNGSPLFPLPPSTPMKDLKKNARAPILGITVEGIT